MKNKKPIAKCPLCQEGYIFENPNYFTCSRYRYGAPGGCKFNIRKRITTKYEVEISENTIKTMIETGAVTKIVAYPVKIKLDVSDKNKMPKYVSEIPNFSLRVKEELEKGGE